MKTNLICITCPIGCRLTVVKQGDQMIVEGNQCKRGIKYAEDELTNPTRMIPTTVVIEGSHLRRLPVRTESPVKKGLIFDCMREINKVVVKAPVKVGDVIIENILNTGVNIIATRSMEKI
jgi:CxxC motif-containing protein